MAFPGQKQTPSSFRFCPYVQHGKSGRPLVISLELQQGKRGIRVIIPFTHNAAVLLMRSCIPVLQEKRITGGATWGRKHLAWGLCSCELQTHSRGKQGPGKGINRFCQTGIGLMMMLLQSWWHCLTCSGFPLSLCRIKPKWMPCSEQVPWFAEGWEEKEVWVGSVSSLLWFTDSQNVPAFKQTDSLWGESWETCFWGPCTA